MRHVHVQANESNYPWRTASYGEWSGLRATVRVPLGARMPSLNRSFGIQVRHIVAAYNTTHVFTHTQHRF